jgi:hypothetical protein
VGERRRERVSQFINTNASFSDDKTSPSSRIVLQKIVINSLICIFKNFINYRGDNIFEKKKLKSYA